MYVVLSSGAEELDKPEEDAEDDGAAVELAVIGLLSVVPLVPGGTELAEDGTETLEEGTETLEEGTETLEEGTETLEEGTETLEEGTETLEEGTETGELDDTEEITEDGTPLVVGTETVDPMLLLATGTVLELPTMVVESVLNTGAVVVTLENVDGPVLEAQPSQTVTVSVTVGGGGQNSGGQ
jgi:exonuclease VII small subunit